MHCRTIISLGLLLLAGGAWGEPTPLAVRLFVGRDQDGQTEVFQVGAEGDLQHRWRNSANGAWSAWFSFGGAVLPEITVTTNADGLMEVFAVSRTNGALQCVSHLGTNEPNWSHWTNLGGNFQAPVAAEQNQDGRLEVFAVDATSHAVRHAWRQSRNGPWSGWGDLGGAVRPGLLAGRNKDGGLELFGVAAGGGSLRHCWQRSLNATNDWSDWTDLGGTILPGIVMGQNAAGRLEVFGISSADNSVTRICQTAASTSTNWTQWESFGGKFRPGLAWGQSGDGRMEVFGVDATDNTILHRWEKFPNGSDAWSDWKSLGGTTGARPAVECNEEGDLEVFAVNPTNANEIACRRQISSASDWLDWASLNQPAFAFMARSWQVGEGLPDNLVQAITQTPDGYLWVGTRNGLARFDGIDFVRFDPRNTPEIKNASITALCAGGDGALWIGTEGGGVTRYQDGVFSHFGRGQGLAGDVIRVIYESPEGSLWIGTTTGMTRYRNKQFVNYTKKDGLSSDVVGYFCHDREANLWIATSQGLNRLKKGGVMDSFVMPNGLPNNSVRAIYQDKGGRIWIGSNNGLLWYDQYWANHFFAYSTKYGLSDMFVTAICEGRDGNLWVGTYSGLNRFYGSHFYPQLDNEGQPFGRINALFEDSEGDLWVGTQEGLVRLTRNYFFTYTQQQGLTHNNVMSVLQDRRGVMWAGTWGGGLDQLEGEKVAISLITNGASQNLILSVCEGRDGSIWTGADFDGGLSRLKDGKILRYTWRDGLPNGRIQALHEDTNGDLWIGTSAGLARLHHGKFTRYTTKDGLTGNNVRAIAADHAGSLWFGTEGGANCLTDGRFLSFTASDGLPDNPVAAFYEDTNNVLWIGTDGGGLARYKDGAFTFYTAQEGLFSDTIFSILEDDEGWLWMSCPQGVFRVRQRDFAALDAGRLKSITSIAYGKIDGMESPQCNGNGKPSAWKSRDGHLWFPTTKGLATVDPQAVKINAFAPTVWIEQLMADGKPRLTETWPQLAEAKSTTVRLPPGQGELEFHYTALNLSAPEKSRFKFKLKGVNTDWIDAGTRRTAYYNNLTPGAYRFDVAACNKDGVWNDRGASISFVLTPFYWQTWWFHAVESLALVAAASAGALYATRRRMRRKLVLLEQQQAIEKERQRIARDMHDQLGAGLTQIGLLGEFARRDQQHNGHATVNVEKICDVTRELAQTVDEIVWAVNPRNDTLNKLAAYLAAYAEDFFRGTPVRCRMDIPAGLPAAPLSAEIRHNVFLVVKEALNNVAKHAQATEAWVSLALSRFGLEICIEDNGVGFSLEAADPSRNGLHNMKARLTEIGGALEIAGRAEKGTRIRLFVPLKEITSK